MTMEIELAKCPFCGCVYLSWHIERHAYDWFVYAVHCGNCEAEGVAADSKEAAVAAWNRRASPDDAAGVPVPVREAIGYCWRWAQQFAEEQTDEARYKFMCEQIDMVLAWLDSQTGATDAS